MSVKGVIVLHKIDYTANCRCGNITFTANLNELKLAVCNCQLCRKNNLNIKFKYYYTTDQIQFKNKLNMTYSRHFGKIRASCSICQTMIYYKQNHRTKTFHLPITLIKHFPKDKDVPIMSNRRISETS